jgi:phytoene dehydrogenase-like protein
MQDVLIIGGGHNGLVAACYLAKAGKSVTILEANAEVGGATVSQRVFKDYDARLSRYSYLVSLLPDQIVKDLGLSFSTIGRSVASFTPIRRDGHDRGLLVNSDWGTKTAQDFHELTGSDQDFEAWKSFYTDVQKLADAMAPTMLQKLPTRSELKNAVNHEIWDEIVERPLGQALEARFGGPPGLKQKEPAGHEKRSLIEPRPDK